MGNIAQYKFHILPRTLLEQHLQAEEIEPASDTFFNHEILIWNNKYPFSGKHLQSFPKLKIFISWGTENQNIDEIELSRKDVQVKKIDSTRSDALISETKSLIDNAHAFDAKKTDSGTSNIVYLARHGETQWNKQDLFQGTMDSPLTEEGIKHAKDISEYFSDKKINYIFTSPLGRSLETAKVIANSTNAEVIVIPEFHEMHFGIFQGKKGDEVKRQFSEFFTKRQENPYHKLFISYPEGESYFDVYLRTIKVLISLLAQHDNFVIVGHESLNRILRGVIQGMPLIESVARRQKNNEIIAIDLIRNKEDIISV